MAAKVLQEHALRLEEQSQERDRHTILKMLKCKAEKKLIIKYINNESNLTPNLCNPFTSSNY